MLLHELDEDKNPARHYVLGNEYIGLDHNYYLTGLYYLRARYYNTGIGRFTQEDVIYNEGLNLYAYCSSNPVMYVDSSGYACEPKEGAENTRGSSVSQTYYHVTSEEDAKSIIESGQLGKKGNAWESRVFVWSEQPTKKQASVAGIGKNYNTVIQFETNASFEKDAGNIGKSIENIVKQTTDAQRVPISIKNAKIVGYKKEWWQFWKK